MRRPRIFTWHVHGSYLYYLSHLPHDIHVPVKPGRPPGYTGRPAGGFPWPDNLREVPADAVRRLELDCVLFQSPSRWEIDQHELLSADQRRLPRIYLEHDPPRHHPTDTRHPVDDPGALLVHVTPFNALMWDSGRTPARVIDHGVVVPPGVRYTGGLDRAIAVVNNIRARGRRRGADVLDAARERVPVDLVGMGSPARWASAPAATRSSGSPSDVSSPTGRPPWPSWPAPALTVQCPAGSRPRPRSRSRHEPSHRADQ
jgi:hypothetical protein